MSHKIKERLLTLGLSQRKLAKMLGVVPGTIGNWITGGRSPNKKILPKVAKALETTTNYLLGETDDPTPRPPVEPDEITPSTRADIKEVLSAIQALGARLAAKANNNIIKFPSRPSLAGRLEWAIGAGQTHIEQLQEHDVTEYIPVEAPEKVDFLITVRGDSMSPLIQDGALLFVRKVPPESLQAVPCMSRRPPGCGRICLACEPGAP